MPEPTPFPRPEWQPVPRPGCHGAEGRVLLRDEGLAVAMLRLGPGATIDEHAAPFPIDVLCLEGSGWTSVGDEVVELRAERKIRWPADVPHRLWTEEGTITTLMIERLAGA